jgi:PAS domain S-box-containing protein
MTAEQRRGHDRRTHPGAHHLELNERTLQLLEGFVWDVTDYAVFVLDPEGRIRTWNTGARRIKGYSRDEILGSHFSRFYPEEALARDWPATELVAAAKQGRFEDEAWRVRKDGSQFWANVIITAIRDHRGEVQGFLKITRDLTERRRQEHALRDSEERFRLLVEGVQDYAIFMLDPDGHVVSWNGGAERIKGYAAAEVLGSHFSRFYRPEDAAAGEPGRALEEARTFGRSEREGWRVRKDGTGFWAGVVLTRLDDAEGRLRGYAEVTRDLTERRRRSELEEASRQTNEFLAMLSHELRNPLAPIRNAVALLKGQGVRDAAVSQAVEMIARQSEHLGRLVDDLLDMSRVTLGKIRIERENVDLGDVTQRALEQVRPLIEGRRHRLEVALPPDPVRVLGDGTRLAQVIVNLLTNAAKYTPDGGTITVTVARDGADALVRVRDTGIGFASGMRERMFELFAQGDRGMDRSEGGLGVGLTLSRRLVEMHAGSLDARSEGPGRGSEFEVRLPGFVTEVRRDDRPPAVEGPAPGGSCGRVLVVDDNIDSAESTALLLRLWGLDVQTATDGLAGLELVSAFRPHCVLLDLGLPRVNGYDVARQIRALPGVGDGVMLIAVTGYGQAEDRERSRQAGFDHHLTKPVDVDQLRGLLLGSSEAAAPGAGPVGRPA